MINGKARLSAVGVAGRGADAALPILAHSTLCHFLDRTEQKETALGQRKTPRGIP